MAWATYDSAGHEVADGDYTANVVIWLVRRPIESSHNLSPQNIEILCQQRSAYVDGNPLLWDSSAGGHIDAGETPLLAAVRETREEIGVDLDSSRLIQISTATFPAYHKHRYCYLYDWTNQLDDFKLDPQEVAQVQWIPLTDFCDFVAQNMKVAIRGNHAELAALHRSILALFNLGSACK